MPDRSQFSRWFPQLATSPYWLPNPPWTTFTPPRPPDDAWGQLSAPSDETLPLRMTEYRPSQSNGSWQRTSRPWEQFSLPRRSVGDGLDTLPTRSDAFEQDSSSSQPDWSPAPTGVGGGILAPFERPTGPRSPDLPGLTPASVQGAQPGYFSPVSPSREGSITPFSRPETAFGFRSAAAAPQPYLDPSYSDYEAPSAPTGQMQSNAVRLAGATRALPGFPPLIPPEAVPGTPEWADEFVRGLRGLINFFKSSGGRRGRRKDDDDYCYERYLAEMARCAERKDDYAHADFRPACEDRATTRRDMCVRNGGRPDPREPREWGPEDEEIWRNHGR
jgi:hypothetical protein